MLSWIQKNRQKKQMETLLEIHYPQLYRIAYAWTQEEQCALDLVQETMVKALEKSDQLNAINQSDRWLTKIMHNLFYDLCRHHKKWQQEDIASFDDIAHEKSVETLYIQHQTIGNIHDAIGALPISQKEVIALIDIEGYSYQEAAEILDIPIGTIMSRLHRAREKVRRLMHHCEKQTSKSQTDNNVIQFKEGLK